MGITYSFIWKSFACVFDFSAIVSRPIGLQLYIEVAKSRAGGYKKLTRDGICAQQTDSVDQ